MKKIVLMMVLAAAGCSKKGPDCDAAIGKGVDNFIANMKEKAQNPQVVQRMVGMTDKLRTTLTTRCKEDKWPDDVVTCFTAVNTRDDMRNCQQKLPAEQQANLQRDLMTVMRSTTGMRPGAMGAMPNDPGHPGTLAPSGSDSPAPPTGSPPPAAPSADPGAISPPPTAAGQPATGSGSAAK